MAGYTKRVDTHFRKKSFLHFMKLLLRTLSLCFFITLCSFGGTDNSGKLFNNFSAALYNKTNFQYYLVVRVHNLNTGEVREFCTLGVLFRQALHMEWKLDHDRLSEDLVLAKAHLNTPRLFEFKNTEAISYLGMSLYSVSELNELSKAIDFKTLAKEIREAKIWRKDFIDDEKLMRIYAHGLFNEGILTAEDITQGGILEYVE